MKTWKVSNTDSTKNQKDCLGNLSWVKKMQLVPRQFKELHKKLRNLKCYINSVQWHFNVGTGTGSVREGNFSQCTAVGLRRPYCPQWQRSYLAQKQAHRLQKGNIKFLNPNFHLCSESSRPFTTRKTEYKMYSPCLTLCFADHTGCEFVSKRITTC